MEQKTQSKPRPATPCPLRPGGVCTRSCPLAEEGFPSWENVCAIAKIPYAVSSISDSLDNVGAEIGEVAKAIMAVAEQMKVANERKEDRMPPKPNVTLEEMRTLLLDMGVKK